MTHIKKLVMHGFKSFARRTEIPFENSMNVIVGPNGSGKSNITDALCFVLGRLSIKSIRAAKAANLLFSGNKTYKGSQEAFVELVFDNTDKTFAIDANEIAIRRIVRRNGLSIYKINGQTKTRQELLELLAQGGIDPNGFNIVLQGEIASLIKASPEDRRKIIEEVAGISIYETRKHKSILELEKTEEKLKEVSAVLKERSSYLKNLEKERQQAMSYQKLEETIQRCKATLLDKATQEKEKEIWGTNKTIENQEGEIKKVKTKISEKNQILEDLQNKVTEINKKIQISTSNEQEVLHKEISDLKAELAGLNVRQENFENRFNDATEKNEELKQKIKISEGELSNIQSSSPEIKKKQTLLKETQEKFDRLEKERRKFYLIKSELSTFENKKTEREKLIIESKKELELIEKNILALFEEIKFAKSFDKAIELKSQTKRTIENIEDKLSKISLEILEKEKQNAILQQDIKREDRLTEEITSLDKCPVCKQEVKNEYKKDVLENATKKISSAKLQIEKNIETIERLSNDLDKSKKELENLEDKFNEIEIDTIKLKSSEEKKEQIKKIVKQQNEAREELEKINLQINSLRKEFEKLKNIEEDYDEARLRLNELSFADVDIDTKSQVKQQEVQRLKVNLKATIRDIEESEQELKTLSGKIKEKNDLVRKKEIQEQELYEKFQRLFSDRNELQDKQKVIETEIIGFQHTIRSFEEKINYSKIQKAQFNAQLDSLKSELNSFGKIELIQAPIQQIKERLQNAQFKISGIGNVNMKALEVYDKVEEQCKLIQEKVETIEKEKEQVLRIIAEIDKKKKKSFMKTLESVNEFFTRNFSQLSKKGEVFLELENKQDPFAGGINILIKVSRGKYFDITSLSGGEKTLVALSLIFAIQEYKPYCFYIFDEIDAALDKHNSELLAALIKKYLLSGQYIVITHNDALISEASALYGVSMQENISKVISLKI